MQCKMIAYAVQGSELIPERLAEEDHMFLNTASVDGTVETPAMAHNELLHSLIPFATVAFSTSPTRR